MQRQGSVDRPKSRSEWVPIATNQVRLRHLRQVCGRCLTHKPALFSGATATQVESMVRFHYTLHVTLMSAPFYTSEPLSGENIDWADVEWAKFPENIATSCSGIVIRLWAGAPGGGTPPELVTVWGVYFSGLVFLGSQLPKERAFFHPNSLVFGMTWGYFVAANSVSTPIRPPATPSTPPGHGQSSYSVATMCRIHRLQRAIYKQRAEADRLQQEIQLVQTNPSRFRTGQSSGKRLSLLSSLQLPTADERRALVEVRTRRQVAVGRVSMLDAEREKQTRALDQLRDALKSLRVENHTRSLHVREKELHLRIDKERLSALVKAVAGTEEALVRVRQQLAFRRRQLFQELSEILPIAPAPTRTTSATSYSISDVPLPNSEQLAGCDEQQLSVALGHVAHLVQMICVFLQVPSRYPVLVCSSRSRIVDQASQREQDSQRQFPLYAKGKDRLYFEYAVYLLNKNIAQLRCYCHLNTHDLAATLPNLASLMQRLLAAPGEDAERTQKTWSVSGNQDAPAGTRSAQPSASRWRSQRSSLAGSDETNLNSLGRADGAVATPSAFSSIASGLERCHLTDSPLPSLGDGAGSSYFKRPPSPRTDAPEPSDADGVPSCAVSLLDLAVDHLRMSARSPVFHSPAAAPALTSPSAGHGALGQRMSHHGSAPNLCSPPFQTAPSPPSPPSPQPLAGAAVVDPPSRETVASEAEPDGKPDGKPDAPDHSKETESLLMDAEDDLALNSMSARTEALANTSLSSFKLKSRAGRHASSSSGANA